ncbi:MAG: putative dual-specificity RNA methyltransferase RlmN [Isosphaeraceae bacterium]|nr:MAG: putative dual-specificity RNA methyltransferase RlmN [Isosphaeraceae bacterium]
MNLRPLLDHSETELADWIAGHGFRRYHARQILRWVFDRRATDFAAITELPKPLREQLAQSWTVFTGSIDADVTAPDGTRKLLLAWPDRRRVECVLMAEADRRTACLSTQVGCGMGCVFCASGLKGFERNLTRGEILEQVLRLRNLLPPQERLTHIVVMGMGESLANLDHLLAALDRVCSPAGLGLSPRRVTISTVGLPDKMRALARHNRPYHLAVSLHAADPELRDRLVPINDKVGLNDVLAAADAYFAATGRQVTYEYVLLHGVNDRPEDAHKLGRLLAHRKAHVNLIPFNPVPDLRFRRPGPDAIRRFEEIVRGYGVAITVRKTKGRPIDAACGQLRRRVEASPAPAT